MCLNYVSHTVENAPKTIAYKLMHKTTEKENAYIAPWQQRLYDEGIWYKAKEKSLHPHSEKGTYTSGFHCFASLKDVRHVCDTGDYSIVKVELRGCLTIGRQMTTLRQYHEEKGVPIIVASEMKIIEEVL
jgi:hypothetical protein